MPPRCLRLPGPLLALLLLAASAVPCIRAEEPAAEGRPFLLTTAGWEAPALAEAIRAYAERQLVTEVRLVDLGLDAPDTLAAAAEAARRLEHPPSLGLIVLAAPAASEDGVYRLLQPADGLGIIDTRALAAGNPDEETYRRRLERLVLQACGFLLDFDINPDPFSVMRPFHTLEELDGMGRNFSPPTMRDIQHRVLERGGRLVESPYRVLPLP